MTYGLNVLKGLQNAGFGICEGSKDKLHAHFVIRDGNVRDNFVLTGGSVLQDTGGKADFLCDTFGNDIKDVVALHVQKLILDGRAAAVDN